MREESQLDDMRAAIRGDFERLASRRGEQELMRIAEPDDDPDQTAPHPPERTQRDASQTEPGPSPAPESEPGPEPQLGPEHEPDAELQPEPVASADEPFLHRTGTGDDPDARPRSWLDRLLGRG